MPSLSGGLITSRRPLLLHLALSNRIVCHLPCLLPPPPFQVTATRLMDYDRDEKCWPRSSSSLNESHRGHVGSVSSSNWWARKHCSTAYSGGVAFRDPMLGSVGEDLAEVQRLVWSQSHRRPMSDATEQGKSDPPQVAACFPARLDRPEVCCCRFLSTVKVAPRVSIPPRLLLRL